MATTQQSHEHPFDRVFLVKPGDTIVFGNVGESAGTPGLADALQDVLGLKRVILFAADIDMVLAPHG